MDLFHFLGYFSGLYLIKADMEPSTLLSTVTVIHTLDAILCRLVAAQNGRGKDLWTIAGLLFGVWALLSLFLLPTHKKENFSG